MARAPTDDTTVELVLAYHLLWELTHVVFEHPGLVRDDADTEPPACITCADEAHVGEILAVDRDDALVRIDRRGGLGGHEPGRRARGR